MSILSPALLGATALVLLVSGTRHLTDPISLRGGLAVHGVLPPALQAPVGVLVVLTELSLSAALLAALSGAPAAGPAVIPLLAGGAGLLFAGFAAYLAVVARAHPEGEVPCACGVGEASVGAAVVARAAGLALAAVVGGLTAQGWTVTGRPAEEVVVAAAAALSLAVTVSVLPATRAVPGRLAHVAAPAARQVS